MSHKHFVIELRGGPASGRRTTEALELAASLTRHGHTASLLLQTAALAHLTSARGDAELSERLEDIVAAGIPYALTEAAGVPSYIGPVPIEMTSAAPLRERADALLVF